MTWLETPNELDAMECSFATRLRSTPDVKCGSASVIWSTNVAQRQSLLLTHIATESAAQVDVVFRLLNDEHENRMKILLHYNVTSRRDTDITSCFSMSFWMAAAVLSLIPAT